MNNEIVRALRPATEPLDPAWSAQTVHRIIDRPLPASRRTQRRFRPARALAIGIAALALTGTAAAATGVDPGGLIRQFTHETHQNVGHIDHPVLVTEFTMSNGQTFRWWRATTSTGATCFVNTMGAPEVSREVVGCAGRGTTAMGGLFNDAPGPMIYGIAPYPSATSVKVTGAGVDTTLSINPTTHGYGSALTGNAALHSVTVTYLDGQGTTLGSQVLKAPVE